MGTYAKTFYKIFIHDILKFGVILAIVLLAFAGSVYLALAASKAFNDDFRWVDCQASKNLLKVNPLSANPTKWSNTLKQFVGFCRRIVWVYLTFFGGWHSKEQSKVFPKWTHLRSFFYLIETSRLICTANELIGFYLMETLTLKGLALLILASYQWYHSGVLFLPMSSVLVWWCSCGRLIYICLLGYQFMLDANEKRHKFN